MSGKIKYIRDRIPAFEIPPYKGRRYDDMVPDTLDIQERIDLAVNGLTGPTDPEFDHMIYFRVDFRAHPPIMGHGNSDVCTSKFMESLPLMRLASGSNLNDHIDPLWMEMALRMIGPSGLSYWPISPYVNLPPGWCEPAPKGAKHFATPIWNGRMMGAMTAYMLRDPAGPWEAVNRGIVDGLRKVAITEEDYVYFPHGAYVPGPNGPRHARVAWKPFGVFSSLFGWCIAGLAQFHRASGYEPAVDLAEKLSRFLAFHGAYFGPNGEFLPDNGGRQWAGPPRATHRTHFQHHATPLLGIADHAIAAGSKELQEFVIKAFEWAKGKGCDLVGYFPENIDENPELECSETCEVAAMIGLALKLSAAGLGDYWDNADRWIRNQFVENQLTQADWVYHVAAGAIVGSQMRLPASAVQPGKETTDHVPERNVGAFAGWPSANDWYVGQGYGIMHCCTGNATRTLYYIWEHILTFDRGVLKINLLLNRPSPWADVHSHIPYTGQVDIHVKNACRQVQVRIPEWVKPSQVKVTVNGKRRNPGWSGRYAIIDAVNPKDTVTLAFPIAEQKVEVNIEKQNYFLTRKGNDVVDIYPRGRFCPLYQRGYYRQNVTRWKKVTRFISNERIYW